MKCLRVNESTIVDQMGVFFLPIAISGPTKMTILLPSKITLFRTEKIRERDGVKILSKSIVLENNLPTQKPSQLRELVIPGIQSTHALTMNCETGKVHICFPEGK